MALAEKFFSVCVCGFLVPDGRSSKRVWMRWLIYFGETSGIIQFLQRGEGHPMIL